jgi:cellulose synthase/poly-beta-1,6-N-acetylglucosamine synthase-like glycosyltransferase
MSSNNAVSIIVSVNKRRINVPSYLDSIKRALYVGTTGQTTSFDTTRYEVIFVTNDPHSIVLENVEVFPKRGQVSVYVEQASFGRAMLVSKGIAYAKYDNLLILDADFQLPATTLGTILQTASEETNVIAAFQVKQKKDKATTTTHFQPVTNAFLLSMQKNPKAEALLFTKEVWSTIQQTTFSDKTFAIEFLLKSREAGFTTARYDIVQGKGRLLSKLPNIKKNISATFQLTRVKLQKIKPFITEPTETLSMLNAGVRYKKQQFITHSTLAPKESAIDTFTFKQILFFCCLIVLILFGIHFNFILLAQIIFGTLSVLYLLDAIFNIFLVYRTIRGGSEMKFTDEELFQLKDHNLPIYTILCPLYKEAHMLAPFLKGIAEIQWPAEKLDVLLLLEEDDRESIETISSMQLPSYVRTLVVPNSQPKTKPKACNYGLVYAKGEYVVIFDAEDIPDPMQLKKAYLGFQKADRNVVCLQAKLNYHNSNQNLLTRFFTAEYSWLFDVSLPGLQALKTIIPLGGTSNHFRKEDLITLNGWDPFNVTEDADLGLRIFRMGYRTAIIDSVTLEEANSNVKNWIRQRSRWIKGYMQTYLVHTRELLPFIREKGIQAFMLHLVIGGRLLFIFVNPLLWLVTFAYFIFHGVFGTFIEQAYPPIILYIAVLSLAIGNYVYILGYILGCVKREQWSLIKYIYLIPFYMILISIAGCVAFYQLLFKPYYWEKTIHGLHLVKPSLKKHKVARGHLSS